MALDPDTTDEYLQSEEDAEEIEEMRENPVEYLKENKRAYTAGEITQDIVPREDIEDDEKLPHNRIYNQLRKASEERDDVESFYVTQAEIRQMEENGEVRDADALIDISVPVGKGTGEENKYRFFTYIGKEEE